jgi:hypothetical protein
MKIRPLEAELFHADRREDGETYTSKLIVAFHNTANAINLYWRETGRNKSA